MNGIAVRWHLSIRVKESFWNDISLLTTTEYRVNRAKSYQSCCVFECTELYNMVACDYRSTKASIPSASKVKKCSYSYLITTLVNDFTRNILSAKYF